MKNLKFLFAILALALTFQWSFADSSTTSGSGSSAIKNTILKNKSHNNSHRPNAPSRLYIECFYGEGFVEFIFPDGVQTMEVRVYNGVDEYAGTVSVENPLFELPILSGEYEIECSCDDGRIFSGMIEW